MIISRRWIMGTLRTRLSQTFILVVISVGISVLVVSQILMKVYYEELNQKLNASIAMYIAGEYQLIQKEKDIPDLAVIQALARTAMIINPEVEVYVLGPQGRIIGHSFPPETIIHTQVPLKPLQRLIAGEVEYPFRNIDPRHGNKERVFSAAEIRSGDELQGYLYVVLGGEVFDNLEDGLQNSYSRTLAFIAILFIVIAAAITGALIFNLLVRPLSQLSSHIEKFSINGFSESGFDSVKKEPSGTKDEVTLLTQVFEDMSAKITQQVELLREADEVKRELISNVSHDLRTPLSSIQGYLETLLIKNESLSEQERLDYLHTAMRSSRRLGLLIGDLFELSKLESNQIQPVIEPFSLIELVHDIVQEFSLEFDEKNIEVEVCNDQDNALVYADISLIQRVFENLIRNAIAYTPDYGKIVLRIELPEQGVLNSLKVSVMDTGRGISAGDLPHIFDRFYSNPNHSRQNVASTGLGLAIVKRILELHNTHISVKSTLNQGTRFEFLLSQQAA